MRAPRNDAASWESESRATRSASVTLRTTYRRSVAERRSPTGGIAAVKRAVPASTRACTIGCLVLSCRSVGASNRSMICRFSSSLVGRARPRSRPDPSRKETRAPSMKISSTSCRAMRSVSGPKSMMERSTRSAMTVGESKGSSSPSRATRSYSSTARYVSERTSSRSPSGRSWRRAIRARTSRRISSYASTGTGYAARRARRDRRAARRGRASRGTAVCASTAMLVLKGPCPTTSPDHAARSTRRSCGM